MRVLELFSGIGGWRYALGLLGTVAAAYDISPAANAAYQLNHGSAPLAREIARVRPEVFEALGADTWLLSPPCQPFCRMGNREGLADPRCRAFLHLMDVLLEAPPERLVLENVQGSPGLPRPRPAQRQAPAVGLEPAPPSSSAHPASAFPTCAPGC